MTVKDSSLSAEEIIPAVDLAMPPPPELPGEVPEGPGRTRFCNRCGSVRDPESTECPNCDRNAAAVSAADEQYHTDVRSIRSSLWLYFALLTLSAVFIVWQMVTGDKGSLVTELVSSGAFSLVVLCWCAPSLGMIFNLLKTRFHPVWILVAICTAIPTYLLASSVVDFLVYLGVERLDYLATFSNDGFGFSLAVIAICLQPAIFEELAFRGIIQGALGRVLGDREALIVSALMFGILHLSIPSLPHLLVLGLILGWLRLRTKSLLPGMALHFTHNFLVILSEKAGGLSPW